eukprot:1584203-Prymnesium_polylepis.1
MCTLAYLQCWLEASHPDRHGKQVALLCSKLKQVGNSGLLRLCRSYGFKDMGVFLDWASIPQKDPSLYDPNETPEAKPEGSKERKAFTRDLSVKTKFFGGAEYVQSRPPQEKAAFLALSTTRYQSASSTR